MPRWSLAGLEPGAKNRHVIGTAGVDTSVEFTLDTEDDNTSLRKPNAVLDRNEAVIVPTGMRS